MFEIEIRGADKIVDLLIREVIGDGAVCAKYAFALGMSFKLGKLDGAVAPHMAAERINPAHKRTIRVYGASFRTEKYTGPVWSTVELFVPKVMALKESASLPATSWIALLAVVASVLGAA